MSLLLHDATLSVADSATGAKKSEFEGDSTASVGVMSALLVGGTLTNTPQKNTKLKTKILAKYLPTTDNHSADLRC